MKRFIFILAVLCSILNTLLAQKTETENLNVYVQIADSLIKTHDYKYAALNYKKASEQYKFNKQWIKSTQCLRKAAELNKNIFEMDRAISFIDRAEEIANIHFQNKKEDNLELAEILITKGDIYGKTSRNREKYDKTPLNYLDNAYKIIIKTDSSEVHRIVNLMNKKLIYNVHLRNTEKAKDISDGIFNFLENNENIPSIYQFEYYYYQGFLHYNIADFQKAIEYYNKAFQLLNPSQDFYAFNLKECLHRLSFCYGKQGDSESALKFILKVNEVINKYYKNVDLGILYDYRTLGQTYHQKGNFDSALVYYKKIIQESKSISNADTALLIKIYNLSGLIYGEKGKYLKASEYLTNSLRLSQIKYDPEDLNVAVGYAYVGSSYNSMGEYNKAIQELKKAIQIVNNYPKNKFFLASLYVIVGDVFKNKGNLDKALEYLNKALSIKSTKKYKNSLSNHNLYNTIASLHLERKEYKKALKNYQEGTRILVGHFTEKHHSVARNYTRIGLVYSKMGELDTALNYHNKALKILLKVYDTNAPIVADCYSNIAFTYSSKNKFNESINFYLKAQEIRKSTLKNKHPDIANGYNDLARIHCKSGQLQKAIEFYQLAIISNLKMPKDSLMQLIDDKSPPLSKPIFLESLHEKANVHYELFKKDESLVHLKSATYEFKKASKFINNMRNEHIQENNRLKFNESIKKLFSDAIIVANELYKQESNNISKELIFSFIEMSKSATLSTHLNDIEFKANWGVKDELISKEYTNIQQQRALQFKIQKLSNNIISIDSAKLKRYEEELFNCTVKHDSLIDEIKRRYPKYYNIKYKHTVASINEIQKQIGKNEVLLDYSLAASTLNVVAISKDTILISNLPVEEDFNKKVFDYYIDIKNNFEESELKKSNYLYNNLIQPIEHIIKGKEKLVIIPDESLYYVPFETLCNTFNKNVNSSSNFMIIDHSFSYNHSATLWLKNKTKINSTRNSFIGFAPVFDPDNNNGYILSSNWISDTTAFQVATRSISNNLKRFNNLPHTEKEVKTIIQLYAQKGFKADGYFHDEATEETFKKMVNGYKCIHIASHSFTNDTYPTLSGIAFSQPDTTMEIKNNDDGIFYSAESYNIDLNNTDIVVLSSCKSGLGKLIKGEGFLSLSRGFLYSGTPNILFSIWSIEDEPSKDLMVEFYKNMLKGESYPESLRKAKLKLLKKSKTSAPKYWAGWILIGK